MHPKLINAKPIEPYQLELIYECGEKRIIDMKQYMISDFFKQLADWNYFKQVKVKGEVVAWPNEQDIAPETLYLDSQKLD